MQKERDRKFIVVQDECFTIIVFVNRSMLSNELILTATGSRSVGYLLQRNHKCTVASQSACYESVA